jgi:aldose 1-epimerase
MAAARHAARAPSWRAPLRPSGEQIEIAFGEHLAVVVEVGGGLRTYELGGRALLDGYGLDELCRSGRGQVLVPWPNRLEDGKYEFGGRRHQLALTEPEHGNAIHGLVRWAAWTVAERETSRVLMRHVLHPQPGYPFSLALEIEYELTDAGLGVRTTATNIGSEPLPYGAGAHPYLTVGAPPVDRIVLTVPAGEVLESDDRGIPTGSVPVDETACDFRRPRPIGATVLDHAFTDLERDENGLARVVLVDPDAGTALTLWFDRSYGYVMVFTGDPLPDVDRRSLAVEPMTCPPNAFRSGEGLITIEPGDAFTSSWGIEPAARA